MNPRYICASFAAKMTKKILGMLKRPGSSLPGKIALAIDKDILSHIPINGDVIVVSGTNGKTMTTAMVANIFKTAGIEVVTNVSGANMLQGVVTSLLLNKPEGKTCILEVDEATLPLVCEHITPSAFLFTNVFPDQIERYGGKEEVLKLLESAVNKSAGAEVFLNGDLPIFQTASWSGKKIWYGIDSANENPTTAECPRCGERLDYDFETYSKLGRYHCSTCQLSRPYLQYHVNEVFILQPQLSVFQIDNVIIRLPLAGIYNVYNALGAYAVAREFGIPSEVIAEALEKTLVVHGRQERIQVGDCEVVLNLTKNADGFNQIIDLIEMEDEEAGVAILLNNAPADGINGDWIWETNFEKLVQTTSQPILYGGSQRKYLNERLKVAGVSSDKRIWLKNVKDLPSALNLLPSKKVYILASFTAMNEVIEQLKGYMVK